MKKEKKIIISIVISTLLLDQITKIIAVKNQMVIQNSNTQNISYIIITILAIIMLIRYILNDNQFIKLDTKIILSFAISGAIGNLIDRIWNHNVILFINLGKNIELNLAYFYILIAWIGMAFILTRNSMKIIKDRNNRNNKMEK